MIGCLLTWFLPTLKGSPLQAAWHPTGLPFYWQSFKGSTNFQSHHISNSIGSSNAGLLQAICGPTQLLTPMVCTKGVHLGTHHLLQHLGKSTGK
jgi:hypothetical protein